MKTEQKYFRKVFKFVYISMTVFWVFFLFFGMFVFVCNSGYCDTLHSTILLTASQS